MAKQNKPAIRFKGFTDAWEQRKLENYLAVSSDKNTSDIYNKADVLSVSGDYGIVNQIEFQGRSFAGASVSNYGVVQTGDVVYTKSPLNSNPYGIIKTNKGRPGIVSTLYAVYHPRENAFPNFIQVYFEQHARMNNYMHPLVNKGAKNDMKVSAENALKGFVCFPSYEEQETISAFFQQLDNLITLHQRKCDKLQVLKKAMLEKMFPKNGSSVPEIRFKGFTDAWEQRKLLSCIQKITDFRGRTPKKLGMDWSESGYLALSALNVKDGYIDFSQDVHYGNQALYDKWMNGNELHKGQVLFTTEAPMGNVAQVPDNKRYILSQRTVAFDVKEDVITENFLATLLRSPVVLNTFTSLSSGGTAKGISQKSLAGVDIKVPMDLREQTLLADYFRNIDNLITLHQRELEKLQNIKKSMLEKMFV